MFSICLLLCGDIHPCPGPARSARIIKTPRYPCVRCGKAVRDNSPAVWCDCCDEWTHLACSVVSSEMYQEMVDKGMTFSHQCNKCLLSQAQPLFPTDEDPSDDFDIISGLGDKDNSGTKPATTNDGWREHLPSKMPLYKFECFEKKGLHCLHLNVRSLLSKIDELKIIAQQSRAAVIAVTETWLDCSVLDNEINIAGYVVIRRDGQRDGGGVCLYIRSDLAFNPRSDISHPDVEKIWVELLLPHFRPILIGACYRPPTANNFYTLFENSCIDKERFLDLETIVLGDFNTDVLRPSTTLYKSLNHLMYLCNWSQLINEPTRVTPVQSLLWIL